jgi:hypothetical protein
MKLADYRNTVIRGQLREDLECTEARLELRTARIALLEAMRQALQRR